MKSLNKLPYRDVIGAIIIGACLISLFWISLGHPVSISDHSYGEGYDIIGKPSKYDVLDDSVRKLKNNFEQIKFKAESRRTNLIMGSGTPGAGLGIQSYLDSTGKNTQKFIVLTDFGLNQNKFNYDKISEYYYNNGNSYLRVPIKEKIKEYRYRISYKDKPVKFRYDIHENKILIPLSGNNQSVIIEIICYTIIGVIIFVFVFGFVLLSKFLIGISRNRTFEEVNIRRLFWIAVCCFAMVLLPRIISFVIYLFYFKTLSDGAIYTKSFSSNDFYFTLVGVLFFAIYIAFKRGYQLKQENDLTI